MGVVYRATDTKLHRDVAIKVLPAFTETPERRSRFEREAQLLASLNHPNIASIYGLEESDGVHYLVLELVPGETLADRLKTGAIPVEEALNLAAQIADALDAAHETGVIHRDLKPANIMITPDGQVLKKGWVPKAAIGLPQKSHSRGLVMKPADFLTRRRDCRPHRAPRRHHYFVRTK